MTPDFNCLTSLCGRAYVTTAFAYVVPGHLSVDIIAAPRPYTDFLERCVRNQTTLEEVRLKGRGALSLRCDWGVGIGGGLWNTGILLTEHLCRHAALYDGLFRGKRVLELGSGTGLVGKKERSACAVNCCPLLSTHLRWISILPRWSRRILAGCWTRCF